MTMIAIIIPMPKPVTYASVMGAGVGAAVGSGAASTCMVVSAYEP